MFKLRREQMEAVRPLVRAQIPHRILADLQKQSVRAERDSATVDVVATAPWGHHRIHLSSLILSMGLALLGCGPDMPSRPPRPAEVPEKAVWAGGGDGGVWVLCAPLAPSRPDRYECSVYSDAGKREARGEYILRSVEWDSRREEASFSQPPQNPTGLDYLGWDGESLILEDSLALLPDGVITYGNGNGGALRLRYRMGKQVTE